MMRTRKPDLMWILALIIGLGVLATGFAQDYIRAQQSPAHQQAVSSSKVDKG